LWGGKLASCGGSVHLEPRVVEGKYGRMMSRSDGHAFPPTTEPALPSCEGEEGLELAWTGGRPALGRFSRWFPLEWCAGIDSWGDRGNEVKAVKNIVTLAIVAGRAFLPTYYVQRQTKNRKALIHPRGGGITFAADSDGERDILLSIAMGDVFRGKVEMLAVEWLGERAGRDVIRRCIAVSHEAPQALLPALRESSWQRCKDRRV